MDLSIVGLIKDTLPVVTETIDLTLQRAIQGGGTIQDGEFDPNLEKFIAMAYYESDLIALAKLKEQPPSVAFVVATDGDVPLIRDQMEVSLEAMGRAKLAVAQLFLEADKDELRRAQIQLAAGLSGVYKALIEAYVMAPAKLTAMMLRLWRVLLIELLTTGACTYVDPHTRLGFQVSYTSQIPPGNVLAPLTGSNLWSAPATCKPLENLRDHLNGYYTNLFRLPDAIVMSSAQADQMLNAQDTRIKIAWLNGAVNTASAIDAAQLANMRRPTLQDCRDWISNEITAAAQGGATVPELIVTDAVYYPRNSNGTINRSGRTSYLPASSYVFMTEGLLEGAMLPTAVNGYAPEVGVVLDSEYKKQPPQEYVGVEMGVMPIMKDPRFIGSRKVA